jgi:hypothetical protein
MPLSQQVIQWLVLFLIIMAVIDPILWMRERRKDDEGLHDDSHR